MFIMVSSRCIVMLIMWQQFRNFQVKENYLEKHVYVPPATSSVTWIEK